MNREEYLARATEALRPWFQAHSHPVPAQVRVSVGWPSRGATSLKRRTIGQHWDPAAAADGSHNIFVSPFLGTAAEALDTLAHELVHAASPAGSKHGPKFVKVAKAVGLTAGKPTSAGAGDELRAELVRIEADLGSYPHAKVSPGLVLRTQGTRLLKAECQGCGYTVRVTRKWLDHGAPLCPCNREPMTVDDEEKVYGGPA
jgi:hypothetical protein